MSAVRAIRSGVVLGMLGLCLSVPGLVPPAADAADPTEKVLIQTVRLAWAGVDYQGGETATAVVPGIGNVRMICRRDSTMVQIQPSNRGAETQMWLAKYETKKNRAVVAVKNVRVYRYSTRGDTTGSGTGPSAHEGLNQLTDIEQQSSGYLHGVISQRKARNVDVGGAATPPSTSFNLNWYWNGFRSEAKYSSCTIEARFVTNVTDTPAAAEAVKSAKTRTVTVGKKKTVIGRYARVESRPSDAFGLNWHGDDDSTGHTTRTATIDGIGDLELSCQPGTNGEERISLHPVDPDASVYVESISGEGVIDDHVDTYDLDDDPVSGLVGPVDLPSNGMMRLYYTVAGKKSALIVSSYRKVNDTKNPDLNVCEIGTAPWLD